MLANFAANILEAYTSPRVSARRFMRADLSVVDCVLMVILGVVAHGIIADIMVLAVPSLAEMAGAGLVPRLAEMAVQVVMFFLLSSVAYSVGAHFEGKGTKEQLRAVVAWHALVTGFLAPLNVLGMSGLSSDGQPGAAFPLAIISVGLSVWIFASFVAEAHGFKKIGGVIGATIMGFMLFGLVAMVLMSAITGGRA